MDLNDEQEPRSTRRNAFRFGSKKKKLKVIKPLSGLFIEAKEYRKNIFGEKECALRLQRGDQSSQDAEEDRRPSDDVNFQWA